MLYRRFMEKEGLSSHWNAAKVLEGWIAYVSCLYNVPLRICLSTFVILYIICFLYSPDSCHSKAIHHQLHVEAAAQQFNRFVKFRWLIKTFWAKTEPIPPTEQKLQLVWTWNLEYTFFVAKSVRSKNKFQ